MKSIYDPKIPGIQNRGGKGVIAHKITSKTGNIISISDVNKNQEIFLLFLD